MNKFAAIMDRDKVALEKIGVPAATNIGNVMAMRIKLAIEDSPSPAKIKAIVREYMSHMHPIILDGMVAGSLAGRLRMVKIASKGIANRKHSLGAYDEALAYFRKRMDLSKEDIDKLKKQFGQKALNVVKGASDMVEKKAQQAIAQSIKLGEHVKDAQARLKAAMDAAGIDEASPFLCETLVRTNIAAAYSAGNQKAMQDPDIAEFHSGYQYATVGDDRVSDICQEFDGFTGPKSDEFWQTHTPPLHFNCVPGDTLVSGEVEGALKAFYSGPIVVIETQAGHRLTITVKHPVLTPRGWIAAEKLRKGDTLIAESGPVVLMLGNSQPKHAPARIEDIFEAFALHGSRLAPMTPLDLYGDHFGRDSKICIVGANGVLPHEGRSQMRHQKSFRARLNSATELLSIHSRRALNLLFDRAHASARSLMGAADLSVASLGGHLRPLNALRLRLSASGNSISFQKFDNDSMLSSKTIPDALSALSGDVTRDKIVRIARREFSGHVYDLQTRQGYFIAQGIVISNCRCSLIPLFSDYESNIPDSYGEAEDGDNPVTGLPWGTPP